MSTAPVPAPKKPNEFISVLDHIGHFFKVIVTNPVAENIENDALDVAEIAFPQFDALFAGIKASLGKAQAVVGAMNVQGDTTAQVVSLALSDAQQVFSTYQTATNMNLETAQQQAIVQAALQLISLIPSPVVSAAPAPAVQVLGATS